MNYKNKFKDIIIEILKSNKIIIRESTLIGPNISLEINKIRLLIKNSNIEKDELLISLTKIFDDLNIMFTNKNYISMMFSNFNKDNYNYNEYGIEGAFISSDLKIYIFANENSLLTNLYKDTENTLVTIQKILNHELVHREQYKKIGDKLYYLLTQKNKISYYNNPREVMAYAKTVSDELNRFFSKEQINNFLRNGSILTYTWKTMKENMDFGKYKMFLKYLYNYTNLDFG